MRELSGEIGGKNVALADFRHLPTRCKFVALVPQWDFLNFLAGEAKRFAGFHLRTETEATELIVERGRIVSRVELVALSDIDAAVQLLAAFAQRLGPDLVLER